MKVCIVTVYNSENCGSYWQAFALCSYLKQGGCDVSFMKRKRKGTSHSIVYVGRQTLKWILKGEIEKAQKELPTDIKFQIISDNSDFIIKSLI